MDIFVVGDVTSAEVVETLSPLQQTLNREINPSVYPVEEFRLDRACRAVEDAGSPSKILNEQIETASGHVSIGTMHLAKGLEFRAVAVAFGQTRFVVDQSPDFGAQGIGQAVERMRSGMILPNNRPKKVPVSTATTLTMTPFISLLAFEPQVLELLLNAVHARGEPHIRCQQQRWIEEGNYC